MSSSFRCVSVVIMSCCWVLFMHGHVAAGEDSRRIERRRTHSRENRGRVDAEDVREVMQDIEDTERVARDALRDPSSLHTIDASAFKFKEHKRESISKTKDPAFKYNDGGFFFDEAKDVSNMNRIENLGHLEDTFDIVAPDVVDSLADAEGSALSDAVAKEEEGVMRFQQRHRRAKRSGRRSKSEAMSLKQKQTATRHATSSVPSTSAVWYEVDELSDCEAGTRAVVGGESAGSVYCEVCDVGTFSSETGSQTCTTCPEGRYASVPRSSECEECPAGHECHGTGSAEPRACTAEMYAVPGSANCATCGFLFETNEGSDGCTIESGFYMLIAAMVFLCIVFTAIGISAMLCRAQEDKFRFYDKAYPDAPYRAAI